MQFPRVFVVRQNFPDRRLADIPATVQREMSQSGFGANLRPGSRIAIGVGSRGIANIATIARSVAQYWISRGMKPFIFPAMGSHGAATAEGQADVLAHYGIVEETAGCPIVSSLDVVPLTKTPEGIQTYMDRTAFESDGVMFLGRVKWHTDFEDTIESGLFKMMAIGLGKFAGAGHYHTYAYKLGLGHVIRSIGREVLKSGKILGGLAILEDAYHNTAQLTPVLVEQMERREEELLALAKSWMARIPMDIDVLIVDEMGKDVSGAGMDTKVVNRGSQGQYNPWKTAPRIERIFVRGLSANTYGNAVGVGLADIVTDRLVNGIDSSPTYINAITSSTLPPARIPIHFPADRECLEKVMPTVGKFDMESVRIGWIHNTLELTPIALSENLRAEIEQNPLLEIVEGPMNLEFDAAGDLEPVLSAQPVGAH
jgi:hypothetical protein